MSDKPAGYKVYYNSRCKKKTVLSRMQELEAVNKDLETALSHVNINVFEYDCISGCISFIDRKNPPFGFPVLIENGTAYILDNDILDQESADEFRRLFQQIDSGAAASAATLKLKSGSGNLWCRMTLTRFREKEGCSARVIGTIQDVSDRVMAELRYSKEEQYRMAMLADSRRVYEINVTRDKFMRLKSIEESTDYNMWKPYSEEMDKICRNQVYEEDWEVFLKVARKEHLLQAFMNGKSELYCEYRAVGEDGMLTWCSSTTHLLRDPLSGDIKAFTYAKDIDEQKKRELSLRRQAECDPLTGLYNRAAAERMIGQILAAPPAGGIHGFFLIDIDEFKHVNDTFGHIKGDELLKELSARFTTILRKDDVLARLGGDEFIIFIRNVNNHSYLIKVAKRLLSCARKAASLHGEGGAVSISIGIAIYPRDGSSFHQLYRNSDKALYRAKQSGKNRFEVYR